MNNTFIFLRRAQTKKDSSIPTKDWGLTTEGQDNTNSVAKLEVFNDVDVIFSSSQSKAFLTAKPLADKLNNTITQSDSFDELRRGKDVFLSKDEHERLKQMVFEDPDFTEHDWETGRHALERFTAKVNELEQQFEDKKIIIVSHGTILTLYFAFLQDISENLISRWKRLGFCDFGIVKNNKVIKDIV